MESMVLATGAAVSYALQPAQSRLEQAPIFPILLHFEACEDAVPPFIFLTVTADAAAASLVWLQGLAALVARRLGREGEGKRLVGFR